MAACLSVEDVLELQGLLALALVELASQCVDVEPQGAGLQPQLLPRVRPAQSRRFRGIADHRYHSILQSLPLKLRLHVVLLHTVLLAKV